MGVYKRGNRWWLDFRDQNGRRIRERVTIKGVPPDKITKQQAQWCLDSRRGEVADGKFNIASTKKQVSFEKLANSFLEEYSKTNKRSWKRDRTSSNALLEHFGGKNIAQITPWLADKYKSKRLKTISRLGRPITKASVNRELACLKTMLNYAVRRGWLVSNPLSKYKLYKERLNKLRVVNKDEFDRVYNEASEILKPILMVAYCTGMRRSEILNLKWENVDLGEGHIRVEESKNDDPRYIPLNKQLIETLKSVKYNSAGEYVFSREGEPLRCFKTAFDNAVKRSGVKRFTFHDLRHTFASNLVMNGVDLVTVQELLGHKSLSMTKRYSHPTPEHKRKAVEGLVTILDKNANEATSKASVSILDN